MGFLDSLLLRPLCSVKQTHDGNKVFLSSAKQSGCDSASVFAAAEHLPRDFKTGRGGRIFACGIEGALQSFEQRLVVPWKSGP
jgi:hypothetical protein